MKGGIISGLNIRLNFTKLMCNYRIVRMNSFGISTMLGVSIQPNWIFGDTGFRRKY
jgi:hypothetical protein